MTTLYDRKWRKRRAAQLAEHPLCEMHLKITGQLVMATVADHIVPHRGDPVKFAGPLQSVCKQCHDSVKQRIEHGDADALLKGCDVRGLPLDPRHAWNRER